MKFALLILAAFAAVLLVSSNEINQFKNYKLLRLKAESVEAYKKMSNIELNDPSFDIWKKNDDMTMDVLLSPAAQTTYAKFFELNKISVVETLVEDAQTIFDAERESMRRARNQDASSILFTYARYDEIVNFVNDIVQKNSDLASSYLAGKTHEGKSLPTVVLKTPTSRRSIWIDCGIHAREWVSPATCVYTINQLIEEYRKNDPETVAILKKYEIHILPLLNPDGYEHTHTKFRMWRKNRAPNRLSAVCPGTDLNRNFDNYWLQGGSSTNPCSDVYAGKTPASELETQAVVRAIGRKNNWDAFISIHSYGQWWLTPYGYAVNGVPADYEEIKAKGQIGADAIKAYNGSVFVVGNSASLLYVNTGSSKDWAKDAGIKYSYVLELRPGQGTPESSYGFALPVEFMPLVATETYLGMKAFFKSIL